MTVLIEGRCDASFDILFDKYCTGLEFGDYLSSQP